MNNQLTMTKSAFVTLLTMLFVIGAAATFTGCNTVEGAGQDIEKAGSAISEEAREHK
jgi:predicted small secreted protein